jgi:sortase A
VSPRSMRRSGTALAAVPLAHIGRAARAGRSVAHVLIAAGLLALAWTFITWRWQDPLSALAAKQEQRTLARQLQTRESDGGPRAAAARRYRLASVDGEAMGRISIPRIGLHLVLVDGTTERDLARGPGIYTGDYLPGEGRLVYIAGHRTTHGAPFSRLEELRPGNEISVALPYGTFVYVVTGHRIVSANDIAVLRSHRREQLVLQTCHPRFSASHRYLVYAKPAVRSAG